MKRGLFFLFIIGSAFSAKAQTDLSVALPGADKTYAVVLGISGYQDASIPKLNYADKDANLFAQWLQSKAGGSVPGYNIKLLTNQDASIAALYAALNWLQDIAGRNDIVYIYFSGHGDMEIDSASISKGYLLAYNSPPNNYSNNAVSINDLNNTANILTINNGAKVILITDACHSGKLAGDVFKGKQLTAKNLRAVHNTQVRMTSCADDELSAEGPAWGDGRGIFSYYLLLGLNGMADTANNKTITVGNLDNYIQTAFKDDAVLKKDNFKQHPVIEGNPFFPITQIDAETFAPIHSKLKNSNSNFSIQPAGLQSLKSVGIQPIDFFFERAKTDTFEKALDFSRYYNLPADSVPLNITRDFLAYLEKALKQQMVSHQNDIELNDLIQPATLEKLEEFGKQLLSLKYVIARFNEKFVQMVQTKGQDMINAYLKGDVAEIERRQYYYSGTRTYTNFLKQLQLAQKLVNPNNYLARILAIQYSYLAGLNCRLAMETTLATDSLLQAAFIHQTEALKLDPYAPYIHNEIGNLYNQANRFDSADYHFNMASVLAPTWAIPWSNKIKLNLAANKFLQAKEAINKAISLQTNLAYVRLNAGLVMEREGNLLAAESYYLQAIAQNDIHYLPFERLGKLYIKTGEIGKADFYLYQANRRKATFTINDKMFTTGIGLLPGRPVQPLEDFCPYVMPETPSLKAFADLYEALLLLKNINTIVDTNLVIMHLKNALQANPNLPLAHHYLGKIYFHKGDLRAAENELKLSVQNFKDKTALKRYLYDSLAEREHGNEMNCLAEKIIDQSYNETEDHYMLAFIKEKQQLNDEALKHYQQIISIEKKQLLEHAALEGYKPESYSEADLLRYDNDTTALNKAIGQDYTIPPLMGGYLKAALLYEATGKYFEAEKILLDQINLVLLAADRRHEAANGKDGIYPASNVNYYWFLISRDVEAATYHFYNRMLALDPLNPDPIWKEKAALFLYKRLALSYNQIPVSEQNSFYNAILNYKNYLGRSTLRYIAPLLYRSMRRYAYPWLTLAGSLEDNKYFQLQLPGSNEKIRIEIPDFEPVENAVKLMEQAIKLSGDLHPRRELAEAMADLYSWSGKSDEAIDLYNNLVIQFNADSSLRNKLIDNLITYGRLPEARQQLDSLFIRKQINTAQLPVLARYHLLSGAFKQADEAMSAFVQKDDVLENEMMKFFVNKYLFENNAKKALRYLKDSLRVPSLKQFEVWKQNYAENEEAFFRLYSIAVSYQQLNKKGKAMKALNNLLEAGFMYKHVLDNDSVWDKCRNTKMWSTLLSEHNFKIDYTQKTVDDLNNGRWFKIPLYLFETDTKE